MVSVRVPTGGRVDSPGVRRVDLAREGAIEVVVDHLRTGGLLAYPTETLYGLGCLLQDEALARLARFKGRELHKPFLLLVGDRMSLRGLRWTDSARALADAFWPGPLTLVLQDEVGAYPRQVRGPGSGVAVRVSPRRELTQLFSRLDEPLTSTSANRAGEQACARSEEVAALLEQDPEGLDGWLLVEGAGFVPGPPSTIVDCTGELPAVIRSGAIPPSILSTVVSDTDDRTESRNER